MFVQVLITMPAIGGQHFIQGLIAHARPVDAATEIAGAAHLLRQISRYGLTAQTKRTVWDHINVAPRLTGCGNVPSSYGFSHVQLFTE